MASTTTQSIWPMRLQQTATFLFLLYVLFLLGRSAWANAERNEQNTAIREQIAALETETVMLAEQIAYQQTITFKELEARRKLGIKKPGEVVIALPPEPDEPTILTAANPTQTSTRDTLNAWWEYYFR